MFGAGTGAVAAIALAPAGLAPAAATAATVEAETLASRGAAAEVHPAAHGGRALVLRAGEAARRRVALPAFRRVVVRAARRDTCGGRAALRLRIGKRAVGLSLRGGALRSHRKRIRMSPGRRRLVLRVRGASAECRPALRIDHVAFGIRSRRRVPLGAAVWWRNFDPPLQALATRDFDSITSENDLKMDSVQPERGRFDFRAADALVAFARANGMELRGHTLVWGNQLPRWLTNPVVPWTRAELLAILEDHIRTVVGRYRGQIAEWDVVNEAIDEDGAYTRNFWLRNIGPEYIELAFRWARAADRGAKLFYNDFGNEVENGRAEATRRLVSDLRGRGVPIDGVGVQRHAAVADTLTTADLVRSLRSYARLGVSVRITEMDVVVPAGDARPGVLRAQARVFRRTAEACRRVRACTGLTVWGLTDPLSWRGAEARALLFDGNALAKPAFFAVREALP